MRSPTLRELPPPPPGKSGWPWTEESPQKPDRMPDGGAWPKISIVTPSFNQGQYIEETIRSVLLQGYPDLEYIVIDGGSTDGSVEVIRKYAHWLVYWANEKDHGQAHAINKGFAHATGEILGYLNSDDIYWCSGLPPMIGRHRGCYAEERILLAAPVQDFNEFGVQGRHLNSQFGRIDQWLDGGISLHQPGCLWTRKLWQECGPLREDLHYIFDRYFFALSRIAGARLLTNSATLAGFRLHTESKTSMYFLDNNNDCFTAEWHAVLSDIERQLTFPQRAALSLRRNLRENWVLVSQALGGAPAHKGFRPLLAKIQRNPLWVIHRPVASALVRLVWLHVVQLWKRCLAFFGKS